MPLDQHELETIVRDALDVFYKRRIQKLSTLNLRQALRRKDPYLFRAMGIGDANELVEQLLSAFMSSSDEGIFGDAFFEPVAKAVGKGSVSPTEGVDVVIETDTQYKAFAIKSGTNVFNSQSRRRQETNFNSLRSRMFKLQKQFDAVVGYCYGKKTQSKPTSMGFREIAGQQLWEELTGDSDFYIKVLEAMKEKPAEHKIAFSIEWDKAKNRFARELTNDYCYTDGTINWAAILKFNSAKREVVSKPPKSGRGKNTSKKTQGR